MPNPAITKTDLEERLFAAEVGRFSGGSDEKVVSAIATAWDTVRSAALNVFTAESWDALTAETLPFEAKKHIVSDACEILSTGSTRDEQIEKNAEKAQQWRSWLVGDKVRCFDDVLTRLDAGDDHVSFVVPCRKFDRRKNDYWTDPKRS
jgi:hypothetical protein